MKQSEHNAKIIQFFTDLGFDPDATGPVPVEEWIEAARRARKLADDNALTMLLGLPPRRVLFFVKTSSDPGRVFG